MGYTWDKHWILIVIGHWRVIWFDMVMFYWFNRNNHGWSWDNLGDLIWFDLENGEACLGKLTGVKWQQFSPRNSVGFNPTTWFRPWQVPCVRTGCLGVGLCDAHVLPATGCATRWYVTATALDDSKRVSSEKHVFISWPAVAVANRDITICIYIYII